MRRTKPLVIRASIKSSEAHASTPAISAAERFFAPSCIPRAFPVEDEGMPGEDSDDAGCVVVRVAPVSEEAEPDPLRVGAAGVEVVRREDEDGEGVTVAIVLWRSPGISYRCVSKISIGGFDLSQYLLA